MRYIRFSLAGVLLASALAFSTGCAGSGTARVDYTQHVETSAVSTGAYVDAAKRSLETLKSKVVAELQPWIKSIQDLLDQAQVQVDATRAANASEKIQHDADLKRLDKVTQERDALDRSIGHRIQVWATRAWYLLWALVAFHYVGMALGLLIPGPVGFVLSVAARFVNPFGWAQAIADNIWFRRIATKTPTAPTGKDAP